jgi:hypothetical protein
VVSRPHRFAGNVPTVGGFSFVANDWPEVKHPQRRQVSVVLSMEKAFLSAILIGVAVVATTLCCVVLM